MLGGKPMGLGGCLVQLLRLLVAGLLLLGIIFGIPTSVALHQLTDGEQVKAWLAQAQFYETMPYITFATTLEAMAEDEDVPDLVQGEVLQRYSAALPQQEIGRVLHQLIDGHYRYLRGTSDRVEIVDETAGLMTFFAVQVPQLLDDEIRRLPDCETGQTPCMMAGVNRQVVSDRLQQRWRDEYMGQIREQLTQPMADGETLDEWRQFVQRSRQYIELCVAGLLLTSGFIAYSLRDRHQGFRSLRTVWFVGSLGAMGLLILTGWLVWRLGTTVRTSEVGAYSTLAFTRSSWQLLIVGYQRVIWQTLGICSVGVGLSWLAVRWTRPQPTRGF
jgi:hypothetical protein